MLGRADEPAGYSEFTYSLNFSEPLRDGGLETGQHRKTHRANDQHLNWTPSITAANTSKVPTW
jgi:hypothetical protein